MPEDNGPGSTAGGGANSSDFVRKLYNMLKDRDNHAIVRWGDEGDTFVVIESDRFTKEVLPKHFKHSNFSSFVRQLNKYDFHKVRRGEESCSNSYGTNTWEFKHPRFKANGKENLDDIRRKAPAARKSQPAEETIVAAQNQLSMVTDALSATQQQVNALQVQMNALMESNKTAHAEFINIHKSFHFQRNVAAELINFMENRCKSSPGINATQEEAELRRIKDLLGFGHIHDMEKRNSIFSPGTNEQLATMYTTNHAVVPMIQDSLELARYGVYPVGKTNGIDPFSAEHMKNIPYQFPSDACSNMLIAPTPLSTTTVHTDQQLEVASPSGSDDCPDWGKRAPNVYLIEDDKICSRIGTKFLRSLGCNVETADDGLLAVTHINQRNVKFDLIFMDIIMPRMDGVSATACIREHMPTVPIIAMTANIRAEDIEYYYSHGMSDVLAKPFTKPGMLAILRKHLLMTDTKAIKNSPDNSMSIAAANMAGSPSNGLGTNSGMTTQPNSMGPETPNLSMSNDMVNQNGMTIPSNGMMQQQQQQQNLAVQQMQQQQQSLAVQQMQQVQAQQAQLNITNLKYEQSSPAPTSNWNSPRPMSHQPSPVGTVNSGLDSNGYPMNGVMVSQQRMQFGGNDNNTLTSSHHNGARMHSELIDERPDKRPRLYGPEGSFAT